MRVDTIVVGAGSSGCVVAARVSESGSRDVLLVEAGPDYREATWPRDLRDGTRNSMFLHDWGFRHRPTRAQVRFPLPRGRVVGGSSAVNTCIAIRPLPRDLDEWDLDGWRYDQCVDALTAIETDLDYGDAAHHGDSGPLPLRRHPVDEWEPWQVAFVEAVRSMGFPDCADTNDPSTPEGVGPHAMNKRAGRRVNAAQAWLTPAVRGRRNFTLWADTPVNRVVLERGRAVGVEVVRGGERRIVYARRIVLCAGAIQTPRLLLASGIGPAAELRRLGVDVRLDLPGLSGRLLDHPGFACFFAPRVRGLAKPRGHLIQTVLRYTAAEATHAHDMQMQPGSFFAFPFAALPGVSIMASIGKPKGHGHLSFPSLDRPPRVESNFLADPVDHRRAAEAMQLAMEIAHQPETRKLVRPFWPSRARLSSLDSTLSWVLRATDSGYHPCGTVPMGGDSDPAACLDRRCRVRGLDGLWVADASVFPTIPTGNIHLTTLMVGEKVGGWLAAGAA